MDQPETKLVVHVIIDLPLLPTLISDRPSALLCMPPLTLALFSLRLFLPPSLLHPTNLRTYPCPIFFATKPRKKNVPRNQIQTKTRQGTMAMTRLVPGPRTSPDLILVTVAFFYHPPCSLVSPRFLASVLSLFSMLLPSVGRLLGRWDPGAWVPLHTPWVLADAQTTR